jgi:hypothetical protein
MWALGAAAVISREPEQPRAVAAGGGRARGPMPPPGGCACERIQLRMLTARQAGALAAADLSSPCPSSLSRG